MPIENISDSQLNALIAEQIMNWLNVRLHIEVGFGGDDPSQPKAGVVAVPHYSTDISAAMEVVEKMRESEFAILMRCVNRWYVEFSPRTVNPDQDFGRVQDESLPRAICLAALSAIKS